MYFNFSYGKIRNKVVKLSLFRVIQTFVLILIKNKSIFYNLAALAL